MKKFVALVLVLLCLCSFAFMGLKIVYQNEHIKILEIQKIEADSYALQIIQKAQADNALFQKYFEDWQKRMYLLQQENTRLKKEFFNPKHTTRIT